jgi:hypothetical protein
MRSAVRTVVKMSMLVFWAVTPCGLVVGYQRFGGTYRLHLQGHKKTTIDKSYHVRIYARLPANLRYLGCSSVSPGECRESWNRLRPPPNFLPTHYLWTSTFLNRRLRNICSCTHFENTSTPDRSTPLDLYFYFISFTSNWKSSMPTFSSNTFHESQNTEKEELNIL